MITLLILSSSLITSFSFGFSGPNTLKKNLGILNSVASTSKISLPKLPDLSQKSFPTLPLENDLLCNYDLVVIGSGPGGEAAAVEAAKLGAKVAIIEKKTAFGGPTGLTSKAVREAAKRFCNAIDSIGGDRRKQIRGLWKRKFPAMRSEAEVYQAKETRDRILNCGIDLYIGEATLVDVFPIDGLNQNGTIVRVCRPTECVQIRSQYVCIATGSRPNRPSHYSSHVPLDFTQRYVVTATELGNMAEVPRAVVVLGGGVIAVEYATVLAKLGVGVSLVCKETEFLPFLEPELKEALRRRMRRDHVLFVTENVRSIEIDDESKCVKVSIEPPASVQSIKSTATENTSEPDQNLVDTVEKRPRLNRVERRLRVDLVLYSGGRDANSENLGLENIECSIGKYGRIIVDRNQRTNSLSEVFAVGDVTGPPGLASAAQDQARRMADYLFDGSTPNRLKAAQNTVIGDEGEDEEVVGFEVENDGFFNNEPAEAKDEIKLSTLFGSVGNDKGTVPVTLWTFPEIASVGLSKLQAMSIYNSTSKSTFVEGYGYFKDMARGRLSGDMDGFLKIVATSNGPDGHHTIVGVFIFGDGANELIQMGSMLVNLHATIEQVSKTPFAAVTLCGLFQMACDDALQKIRVIRRNSR